MIWKRATGGGKKKDRKQPEQLGSTEREGHVGAGGPRGKGRDHANWEGGSEKDLKTQCGRGKDGARRLPTRDYTAEVRIY